MKVSIIGGGGLVGSMAAYALQCGGVVSQPLPHRRQQGRGPGRRRLDLLHGASLVADQRISAGDMDDMPTSKSSSSPPACAASPTRAGSISSTATSICF